MALELKAGLPPEAYELYRQHLACLIGVPTTQANEWSELLAGKCLPITALVPLVAVDGRLLQSLASPSGGDQSGLLLPSDSRVLMNFACALALAYTVFGEPEKAIRWMGKPKERFDGRSPFDLLLDKQEGVSNDVFEMLVQVAGGMCA